MARSIQQKTRTVAPGGDYLKFGRIKDDSGSNDGTPVDVEVYNDFHEFFDYLMDLANVTANGLPDNDTNGYQLMESLFKFSQRQQSPCTFSGTYGFGSKNITLAGDYSGNYAFKVGQNVRYQNADNSSYLQGVVTAYSGSTLTINVYDFNDSTPAVIVGNVYLAQQQITGQKKITGNWDMDADDSETFAHGLPDLAKIYIKSISIINNAGTFNFPLNSTDSSLLLNGAVDSIDATNITLLRRASGDFDNASWNNATVNILLEYEI